MGALARGAKAALERQMVYFRITWGGSEKGLAWGVTLLSQPPEGVLVHSCQDWGTGPGRSEIRISVPANWLTPFDHTFTLSF